MQPKDLIYGALLAVSLMAACSVANATTTSYGAVNKNKGNDNTGSITIITNELVS